MRWRTHRAHPALPPPGAFLLSCRRHTSHVALRLANVYGPRQSSGLEGGVVAIFLERMETSEPTVIFGDGSQVRDFVFVGDVVDALLAAAGGSGGPFNIGTGTETSVGALHAACAAVAGVPDAPAHAGARLGDVHRSVLDASRAARELGWQPRVPLEDGLARTWAWMRQEAL